VHQYLYRKKEKVHGSLNTNIFHFSSKIVQKEKSYLFFICPLVIRNFLEKPESILAKDNYCYLTGNNPVQSLNKMKKRLIIENILSSKET